MRRSIKVWKKAAPGGKRHALPEEAKDLICLDMVERSHLDESLYVQLVFSLYCRPGEAYRLRLKDVVPPVSGSSAAMQHWTVILAPLEGMLPTKTNEFDEALTLDDTTVPWLGNALGCLVRRRRKQLRERGLSKQEIKRSPLWAFTQEKTLKCFKNSLENLNLTWLGDTLSVLRHGGASRDVARKLRPLLEVQRRGCWAHLDSVKHYEKHGRLQTLLHRMGRGAVDRAQRAVITL